MVSDAGKLTKLVAPCSVPRGATWLEPAQISSNPTLPHHGPTDARVAVDHRRGRDLHFRGDCVEPATPDVRRAQRLPQ